MLYRKREKEKGEYRGRVGMGMGKKEKEGVGRLNLAKYRNRRKERGKGKGNQAVWGSNLKPKPNQQLELYRVLLAVANRAKRLRYQAMPLHEIPGARLVGGVVGRRGVLGVDLGMRN